MTVTFTYRSGVTLKHENVRIFEREGSDYIVRFNAGYPDNVVSTPIVLVYSVRVSA
jgi:hypothetical protein